mgnify:FL=1
MKKIIDLSRNWVVIMTLIFGMVAVSSCSSDDDDDASDLNQHEKALVGSWKSIDDDYEILRLELKKDRTGSFAMYWGGKLEDSDVLKNWMANDKRLFVTYDNGETESAEYTLSGNKLILGDVLYQKQ